MALNWSDARAIKAEAERRELRRAAGLPLHEGEGPPVTSEREIHGRSRVRVSGVAAELPPEKWAKWGREMVEQIRLFDWIDGPDAPAYLSAVCYAIPNSGARSPWLGAGMRRAGLRKGNPDVVVDSPVAPYRGLALELKVPGGKIDVEQAAMHAHWRARGWLVEVVVGWEAARAAILRYLHADIR